MLKKKLKLIITGFIKLKRFLFFILLVFCSLLKTPKIFAEEIYINENDTPGLISAINQANSNNEADVINLFQNSTYLLTEKNNDLYSKNGLPVINSEITINGNNATIVRSNLAIGFRIITITNPGNLILNNLSISGGYDDDRIDGYGGGGILNYGGNLTINNSFIFDNKTEWGGGAGIWIAGSSQTKIFNTKISNNTAGRDGSGGAIQKRGLAILEINNSEISDNYAQNVGGAFYTGIEADGTFEGLISINQTKINNNSAQNTAGAIFNYVGNYNINNSCFLDNSSVSIVNNSLNYLNLTNNYWGSPDGPSGIGPGSGDSIEGNVTFQPFLTLCPDLSPSSSPSPNPEPSVSPSPSPEASPEPSASPSPTPLPSKIPVVVLPGFGGSWNTPAMITGGEEGGWKKTPFVKIYDNLKQTFLNAGYVEGENYFEFYYDWRKPLDILADQLKNYLETTVLPGKPETTKINLIGHSMGGLVARTYGQKYGTDKINQVVTAGSPHQGAITPWLIWSGAETNDHWSFSWLGMQLYLQLQKSKFTSPVNAVQAIAPSLLDITPAFDFAKKNNQAIPINTMSFTNNFLIGLNNNLTPSLKNILNIVYGEIDNKTIEWVNLGERSLTDKLLGKWPDGKPVNNIYTPQGDLTVLSKSAIINEINSIANVSGNHGDIVSKEAGIQAILNALGLTGIIPATGSMNERKNPVLFFFLHSPAQIKVTAEGLEAGYGTAGTLPDTVYSEEDKLLLIQNALSNYQVEIIGQGNGTYGLEIGQLTDQEDNWQEIENTINAGESDFYDVNLSQVKPENPLELTIYQLNKIKNSSSNKKLIKKIDEIINKLNSLKQNQLTGIIADIYRLNYQVGELDQAGHWLLEIIQETDKKWPKMADKLKAFEEIRTSEEFLGVTGKILSRKIKGENAELGMRLLLAEEYLGKAKADFGKELYNRARAEAMVVKVIVKW